MKQPSGPGPLDRARQLRREATPAEKLLWARLRNRQVDGHKFRRQMWLGPFIGDFVCVEARLVVEADGGQHADATGYDERRSDWMVREGYRVLRFWNRHVLEDIDGVLRVIADALEVPSPSHAQVGAGPFLSPDGRGER